MVREAQCVATISSPEMVNLAIVAITSTRLRVYVIAQRLAITNWNLLSAFLASAVHSQWTVCYHRTTSSSREACSRRGAQRILPTYSDGTISSAHQCDTTIARSGAPA